MCDAETDTDDDRRGGGGGSIEQLTAVIAKDRAKWSEVIKSTGMRAD